MFPPTYYQHFELGLLCSLLDPDNPLTGKPAGNTIGITMFIPSFREGAIRLGMMRSLSCVLRVEETTVCLPAMWHMQHPHALPLIANLYVYQLVLSVLFVAGEEERSVQRSGSYTGKHLPT